MTTPIIQDVREFLSHSGYTDDEIERVLSSQTASARQMAQEFRQNVKRTPDDEVPADFHDARERFNERIAILELMSPVPVPADVYNSMWEMYLEGWRDAVVVKHLNQQAWVWRGVLAVTVPVVIVAAIAGIIYTTTMCVPVW